MDEDDLEDLEKTIRRGSKRSITAQLVRDGDDDQIKRSNEARQAKYT